MKILALAAVAALIAVPLLFADDAQGGDGGIEGQEAPKWDIDKWFNLPEGKEKLEISDFRGRVLMLYNYQSW